MTPLITLKSRPLIYGIRNMVNGKLYVGKTICIYKRCHQYISAFRESNTLQINNYLLKSMLKNGIGNFEMFPLEFVDVDQLAEREVWWMDHMGTLDKSKGYNLKRDSSTCVEVSDSTKLKISERLKDEWASGTRSGHSEKMKKSWESSTRKTEQGLLFSRIKTRYEYEVRHPNGLIEKCLYPRLKELGLSVGAISSFHRTGTDSSVVKGYVVSRYLKGDR